MQMRIAIVCSLLLSVSVPIGAQGPTTAALGEMIRGHVTDSTGVSLAHAVVNVTGGPERAYRADTTDAAGMFLIRFTPGFGDYLVHVTATGFRTFRQRVRRAAGDSALTVNVVLARETVHELKPISVVASVPAVERQPFPEAGIGASERFAEGVTAGLSTELQGNIAATAGLTPGATVTPAGVSILGLSPDQTRTTLNGLAFTGGSLPRDARTRTRVVTSSYDPSIGGFSAGALAVELSPGADYASRGSHLTVDNPHAQTANELSSAIGNNFARVDVGVGASGPLVLDKLYFSSAIQAVHARTPTVNLFTASNAVLDAFGIPIESREAIRAAVDGLNGGRARTPTATTRDELTVIGRLDHTPLATTTWGVTGYAHLMKAADLGLNPLAAATHTVDSTSVDVAAQIFRSSRFLTTGLNETRTGVSVSWAATRPTSAQPEFGIDIADTSGILNPLRLSLGGASGRGPRVIDATWDSSHESTWYVPGTSHRLKAVVQSRVDAIVGNSDVRDAGTYEFASPSALVQDAPTTYARALNEQSTRGAVWNGVLALGDYWRMSDNLQLTYGGRLDVGHLLTHQPFDPAVFSTFGVSSSAVPNSSFLSPRLGFNYVMRRASGMRIGTLTNQLGSFYTRPAGVLRGGIGAFRNSLAPRFGNSPTDGSSLHDERLNCVGASIPQLDWANPTELPTACAPGAINAAASDTARRLLLVDRGFRPPTSWRANLIEESVVWGHALSIEGIVSLNQSQPSAVDLNFRADPLLRLPEEANRPVYVPASQIFGSFGVVSTAGARLQSGFGSVLNLTSDARSVTRSLRLGMSSLPNFTNHLFYSAAYVLSQTEGKQRGFYGSTAGDPSQLEPSPTPYDIRHQITTQLGWSTSRIAATLYGRFSSGFPFSPIVNRDINGDGLVNDRAFIPERALVSGPSLDADLQSLIDGLPTRLQQCLNDQRGMIARSNSCRGPWTATVNARLDASRGAFGLPSRLQLGLGVTNVLSGFDQLLHGSAGLQGWGASRTPDPVLLQVRGFDATTNQFTYAVNPRFGTPSARDRYGAPFRLTIDATVDWSAPFNEQLLHSTLTRERSKTGNTRSVATAIQARYARSIINIYDEILQQSDSLLLTREQTDSLSAARERYVERMDSIWGALATELADPPTSLTDAQALRDADEATSSAWVLVHEQAPIVKSFLSPIQLRLVPALVATLINSKGVTRVERSFMR
jgi:hypothetical protein